MKQQEISSQRTRKRVSRRMALTQTLAAAGVFLTTGLLPVPAAAEKAAPGTPGSKRRALLIGVTGYPRWNAKNGPIAGPYDELNTTEDLRVLKQILIEQYGFKESEILVLNTRETTTHSAILAAFRRQLIEGVRPGDTLYFHYSGHGSSQWDRTGRQHQTLVPSDWKLTSDKDPEGHNEILDTEIAQCVSDLKMALGLGPRAKAPSTIPSSVLLTFDCCHSGKLLTGVRGSRVKVRGRNPEFDVPRPANAQRNETARTRGDVEDGVVTFDPQKERGFAALFACRYYQTASELDPEEVTEDAGGAASGQTVKPMGRFTYYLAQALASAHDDTTYRDLFEMVRNRMAARMDTQDPVIEGDQDRVLLKGRGRPRQRYTEVQALPMTIGAPERGRQLRLKAGRLQGVTRGSEYNLFAVGTADLTRATPLAVGRVTNVDLTEATLVLLGADSKPPAEAPRLSKADEARLTGARAVESRHVYSDAPLTVDVDAIRSDGRGSSIIAALNTLSRDQNLVRVLPEAPKAAVRAGSPVASLQIARSESLPETIRAKAEAGSGPGFALIHQPDGTVIGVMSDGTTGQGEAAERLRSILERLSRTHFLRSLVSNERTLVRGTAAEGTRSDGIELQLRMVPSKVKSSDGAAEITVDNAAFVEYLPDNPLRRNWIVGEWFVLQVRNTGSKKAFVSILDLQPDGTVVGVWPERGVENNDIKPDGKWVTLTRANQPWLLQIQDPTGQEVVKAIGTPEPTDFTALTDFNLSDPPGVRSAVTPTTRQERTNQTPLGRVFKLLQSGRRFGSQAVPKDWGTATLTIVIVPAGGEAAVASAAPAILK